MVAAVVSVTIVVFSVLPWWTGVSKHYPRKVGISIIKKIIKHNGDHNNNNIIII
jgi:hypothetical protein